MISSLGPTPLAPHGCPVTDRRLPSPALSLAPILGHLANQGFRDPLGPARVGESVEGPRTCAPHPQSTPRIPLPPLPHLPSLWGPYLSVPRLACTENPTVVGPPR
eukprot:1682850-Rhodomonas_salina.1